MRNVLFTVNLLTSILWLSILSGVVSAKNYDLVILNGLVIDPMSGYEKIANVGIIGDRIAIITTEKISGKEAIDATNLIVSPGFIDILADNSFHPEKTYLTMEKYKITDGVTTVLFMHGGTDDAKNTYKYFQGVPHLTNYGYSTQVMKVRRRRNTISGRLVLIQENLDYGNLGISHSIEYQPTPYEEMVEYAKLAAKNDVPLFLHLRYSSKEKELEGVQEAIDLAKVSGAMVHIDHIHSTGATYNILEALKMIEQANQQGYRVNCCVYPYSYWATYISSTRFDDGWQKRYNLTYEDLTILGTGEVLNKESFYKYRKQYGIIVAVPEGTMPLEELFFPVLKYHWSCIASDGGIEKEKNANNHPRGAGCFAKAIYEYKKREMPMKDVLAKITHVPASFVPCEEMRQRGKLQEGAIADITIFDPNTIQAKASVKNPNQFSEGIKWVMVNGKIALKDKEVIGYYGKLIKRNPQKVSKEK